jgi:hypothetical protein
MTTGTSAADVGLSLFCFGPCFRSRFHSTYLNLAGRHAYRLLGSGKNWQALRCTDRCGFHAYAKRCNRLKVLVVASASCRPCYQTVQLIAPNVFEQEVHEVPIWTTASNGRLPGMNSEGFGGASRDRTDGLVVANDALSQLSYSTVLIGNVTGTF